MSWVVPPRGGASGRGHKHGWAKTHSPYSGRQGKRTESDKKMLRMASYFREHYPDACK